MPAEIAFNQAQVRTDDTGAIEAFIDRVVEAVDKAYRYVNLNPGLGPYALLDGHTEHWSSVWLSYTIGGRVNLPAAAFGYVIESLTTLIYLKDPPRNMTVVFQGSRGPTRPDIILLRGGVDVAWIDLTASKSNRHILTNKVGWLTQVNHAAEVTYPSVDIGALNRNPWIGPADDEDENEVYERILFAKWLHKERQAKWKQLGKELFQGYPRKYIDILRDESRRKDTLNVLAAYFQGATREELLPVAAGLLTALGVSPATHGFRLGFHVSRAEGESFLLEHDPKLLTLEYEKLTIPHPLGVPSTGTPPWKQQALVPVSSRKAGSFGKKQVRESRIKLPSSKIHNLKSRIRFDTAPRTLQQLLSCIKVGSIEDLVNVVEIELITQRGSASVLRRFRGNVLKKKKPLVASTSNSDTPLPFTLPLALPFGTPLQLQWTVEPLVLPEAEQEPQQVQDTVMLQPTDNVVGFGLSWSDGFSQRLLFNESLQGLLPEDDSPSTIEEEYNNF